MIAAGHDYRNGVAASLYILKGYLFEGAMDDIGIARWYPSSLSDVERGVSI